MELASTHWVPDIADWWRQQEETQSKYAYLSNVACDIFSIILPGVGVEACFSLWQVIIGWGQSTTTGKIVPEQLVVTHFTRANNGILAGDCPVLDTTETENYLELKKAAEEKILHRMARSTTF
jgi:hypothetical protein